MNKHLAKITHRQVTGRWMDRGFLLVVAVLIVLGASSVAMAVQAAAAPIVRVAGL
ncbi:MAG: hypothetical protein R3B48_20940 [Kofleriaceae bacterium]